MSRLCEGTGGVQRARDVLNPRNSLLYSLFVNKSSGRKKAGKKPGESRTGKSQSGERSAIGGKNNRRKKKGGL